MKIHISIHADGRFFNESASIMVDDPLSEVFEPLHLCDDYKLARLLNETYVDAIEAKTKIKFREDVAKDIVKKLTHHLFQQMKKYDTLNGYKQTDKE